MPDETKLQTLAEGTSAQEEMARKYPKGANDKRRAQRVRMIAMGKPGTGKSWLLQSCPYMGIINFDMTPLVYNGGAHAALWPSLDQPPPVWPDVEAKVAEWIADRRIGNIAFDSYGPMLNAAREYAAWRLAKRAADASNGTIKFNVPLGKMDPWAIEFTYGENVYKIAYGWISRILADIDAAGKGWAIALHVDREMQEVEGKGGQIKRVERVMPVATIKQMRRLYGPCDASVLLEHTIVRSKEGSGALKQENRTDTLLMHTQAPSWAEDLDDYIKVRIPMPCPKPLPGVVNVSSGWTAFEQAWNNAVFGDTK